MSNLHERREPPPLLRGRSIPAPPEDGPAEPTLRDFGDEPEVARDSGLTAPRDLRAVHQRRGSAPIAVIAAFAVFCVCGGTYAYWKFSAAESNAPPPPPTTAAIAPAAPPAPAAAAQPADQVNPAPAPGKATVPSPASTATPAPTPAPTRTIDAAAERARQKAAADARRAEQAQREKEQAAAARRTAEKAQREKEQAAAAAAQRAAEQAKRQKEQAEQIRLAEARRQEEKLRAERQRKMAAARRAQQARAREEQALENQLDQAATANAQPSEPRLGPPRRDQNTARATSPTGDGPPLDASDLPPRAPGSGDAAENQ